MVICQEDCILVSAMSGVELWAVVVVQLDKVGFQPMVYSVLSLIVSVIIISPPYLSQAILKRRCIPVTQVITVVFALVGAVLITRPNFLFHHSEHDPLKYPNLFRAYGIAFIAGILAGMQYIFLAFCPNVHWSVWQVCLPFTKDSSPPSSILTFSVLSSI